MEYADPSIEEILSQEGNNQCFDCGADNPKWASINNGIFLCLKCAGVHRGFGLQISIIRSLQIDTWTPKQILFLSKGGNNKFKEFLSEYKIVPTSCIELKYKSKAAKYYRELLNTEVEKSIDPNYISPEIEKPNLTTGVQILEIKENDKEINNDFIISSGEVNTNNSSQKDDNSFFGYVNSFFKDFSDIAKDAANSVSTGLSEFSITDTVLNTGNKMWDYAKQGGEFIVNKTKEVANSEMVQNFTKNAGEGINNLVEKSKILLNLEQEPNPNEGNNEKNDNLVNNINFPNNQLNPNIDGTENKNNINMNAENEKKSDENIKEDEK